MLRSHTVRIALLLACIVAARASFLGKKESPVEHVAIIMVDGMHQEDIANYVVEFPNSNIAELANTGVTYNNMFLPAPSDSWPALAHQVTGSGPGQHGIMYEQPYSRGLYPPKSGCSGTPGSPVDYSEDSTNPDTALTNGAIDPSIFPLNKTLGCTPVYPNNYILVNTIFGVATAAGMKTAWSDKAVQYTFVAGPGDPLDLSDRITEFRPYSIDYLLNKKDIPSQIEFDLLHANAIQSWIKGNYANGTATSDGKPFNLFGSSFQALNAAQKSADTQPNNLNGPNGNPNVYLSGGYGDSTAMPNDPSKTTAADPQQNTKIAATLNKAEVNSTAYFLAEIHTALAALDSTVGQTINALKKQGIYEKSVIIFTSKHGNSPIDHATLVRVDSAKIVAAINAAIAPATVAKIDADTGGYIWLSDSSASTVVKAAAVLNTPANLAAFHTAQVLTGSALQSVLGSQADRIPDLFVEPVPGVVYTTSLTKVSDHGGAQYNDLHLATIISGPMITPNTVSDTTSATQIGVTALDLLGLDYTLLQGAAAEGTKPLPGLSTGKSQLASDMVGAITKPIGDQISGDQKVIDDVVG